MFIFFKFVNSMVREGEGRQYSLGGEGAGGHFGRLERKPGTLLVFIFCGFIRSSWLVSE
jgi:hypothetical protein